MGYGLKILSANGSVQLDTDSTRGTPSIYQLVLRSSSPITTAATASNGTWVDTSAVNTGITDDSALVFVRPVYGSGTNELASGTSISVNGTISGGLLTLKASGAKKFDYAVFIRAPALNQNPSGYGLVVYDSNGTNPNNIIFNGFNRKALRIKGHQEGTGTVTASGNAWWGLIQSKYAYVRRASYYNTGLAVQYAVKFTNDSNKNIEHHTPNTWFTATDPSAPQEDLPETYNLSIKPYLLVAEIDE